MPRANNSTFPPECYLMKGRRVGLRSLRKEDIPTMARWFQDLEYSTYISCRGWYATAEDEVNWYDQNAKCTDTGCQFAIVELSTGRHVGNCGLFDISARHQRATLGIGIG